VRFSTIIDILKQFCYKEGKLITWCIDTLTLKLFHNIQEIIVDLKVKYLREITLKRKYSRLSLDSNAPSWVAL